jgi:sugar O-acyltransferase (sialic acid O-acetyltransferase NeuD family)
MTVSSARPIVIFGTTTIASLVHHFFVHDAGRPVVGFTLDRTFIKDATFEGRPVVPFDELREHYSPQDHDLFVAVGYSRINGLRRERFEAGTQMGYQIASHVARGARTWSGLQVGPGCLVYEGAILQAHTTIEHGVVVRAGANIGHHGSLGSHSFIASSAVTGGNVRIGSQVFVGLGATIRDNVTIADRCMIGAGAVVLRDTEPDGVYVGSPARRIDRSALDATS